MKSALSSKVAAGEMIVVNKVEFDGIKTKNVVAMLKGLKAAKKTLITQLRAMNKFTRALVTSKVLRLLQ